VWRPLLGTLALMFGVALVALPAWRVVQGLLTVRQAVGLWTSGVGFLLLAAAALLVEGDLAQSAVRAGVVVMVVGYFVQQLAARAPR